MTEILPLGGVALLALLAALWPLWRGGIAAPARAGSETSVYRDQLAELDRDVARGVLAAAEAEAARVEIARRLLAAAEMKDASAGVRRRGNPALALVIGLLVVCDAGWVYLRLGAPGVPDMPFASRPAAPPAEDDDKAMAAAISALKDAAERDPGNAARWLVLARAEGGTGDWKAAAFAYRQAIGVAPDNAEAYLGLGAALTVANDSVVPEPARAAFERTLELAPKNDVARFYLALADAQAGRMEAATKAWLALAGELPAENAVREEIAKRLANAGVTLPPPAPPAPPPDAAPGPDAGAMAGAAQMTPEARAAFIKTMIARLAARMETTPNDIAGWLRLARAYRVSGDAEKARAALARAVAAKPDDPEVLLAQGHELVDGLPPDQALPDAAIAVFKRLEALDPAQPDALWYLGLAASQARDAAAARGYWARLLPLLGPESAERKMVEQALATVPKK